jgi:simple sugar transport system permease protein
MNSEKAVAKEPLVRIAKRDMIPAWKGILFRFAAILAALILDAVFIYFVTGLDPIGVYSAMFQGTFGGAKLMRFKWAIEETAKLLIVSLALAPAFKMRFWNVGGEGPVLVGALWTAFCMINFSAMPPYLLFPVMAAGAIIFGALWGLVPAIFKAKFSTNETLFTLMMNYIAIQLVAFTTSIWRGNNSSLGVINMDSKAGWFPVLFGDRSGINLIVAAVLTILMFIYLKYSKHGYEISVVGESENTARYAGINVSKVILRTMALSGALCGVAGFMIVSGGSQTVSTASAGGRGFDAIIVAWLSKFNAFYMVLTSFLLVFLEKGAKQIASTYSIMNDYASDIISGIILFFIIGCEFFLNYKLIFRTNAKEKKGTGINE